MILQLFLIVVSCFWIKFACDPFEESSDYLGRGLTAGVKGATINAIASSLPELFTTISFLFIYNDKAGFASGVATTAGSAVFNIAVIPAAVIFAVLFMHQKGGIKVSKRVAGRDGIFYVASIIALVFILKQESIGILSGGILLAIYIIYVVFLIVSHKRAVLKGLESDDEEEEEEEEEETNNYNVFVNILRFDYRNAFSKNGKFTAKSAWIGLILATIHVALACHLLAGSIVKLADAWNINTFFVAVVLAAAATSVPDTIMSVKDGLKGNYDDAVSNAVGSNIFDICVSLGLPLLLYTIFKGPISLGNSVDVVELLLILIVLTIVVLFFFLVPKRISITAAIVFVTVYGGYVVYALSRGAGVEWAVNLGHLISGLVL